MVRCQRVTSQHFMLTQYLPVSPEQCSIALNAHITARSFCTASLKCSCQGGFHEGLTELQMKCSRLASLALTPGLVTKPLAIRLQANVNIEAIKYESLWHCDEHLQ